MEAAAAPNVLVVAPGFVTRSAVPKRTAASRARLRQSSRLLSADTRSSVGVSSVRLPSLSPASTRAHSRSESSMISCRSAISFCKGQDYGDGGGEGGGEGEGER